MVLSQRKGISNCWVLKGRPPSVPLAGIQGRAYYEASQIKLRRNRMLIRAARTTNMLLHSALELLKQKELASRKESAGLDGVRKQAKILRAQFDAERAKAVYLQLDVSRITTELWNLSCCYEFPNKRMQKEIHIDVFRSAKWGQRIFNKLFPHCSCKSKSQRPDPQRLIALMYWTRTHLSWSRYALLMPDLGLSFPRPKTLKLWNYTSKTC